MATKAERFRYDSQRGKRHLSARKKHAKRRDTPDIGARNVSRHADKKATVMTEETRGRRSRKSSRTSSNRGKNSGMLEYAARQRSFSPETRHGRRS
jgi:hypothetical protein